MQNTIIPHNSENENATPFSNLLIHEDGSLPLDEKMALEEQISLLMRAVDSIRSQLTDLHYPAHKKPIPGN